MSASTSASRRRWRISRSLDGKRVSSATCTRRVATRLISTRRRRWWSNDGRPNGHESSDNGAHGSILLLGAALIAQGDLPPTNNLPNGYRTVADYFRLPEERKWGSTSAVEIDKDGRSIWVAERCGANTCAGSTRMSSPSVLKFDATGKLVDSFGAGMLIFPHGIHVDRDGNVWVTTARTTHRGPRAARCANTASRGSAGRGATKGHQVFKFSPEGKLLMTLGKPGGAATRNTSTSRTTCSSRRTATSSSPKGTAAANSRILKFIEGREADEDVGDERHRRRPARSPPCAGDGLTRAACSSAIAATTGS